MKNIEEDMVRIPLSRKTKVTVYTNNRSKWPVILSAKIDTGADISSIDKFLAESLGLETVGTKRIRNAHGVEERDCVNATLTIDDIDYQVELTCSDRWDLKFPVLLGFDVLETVYLEE